jgi:hypothetical protein
MHRVVVPLSHPVDRVELLMAELERGRGHVLLQVRNRRGAGMGTMTGERRSSQARAIRAGMAS